LSGDFKITFEYYPYVAINAISGANDKTKAIYTYVKIKDKMLYRGEVENEAVLYYLYCMENGTLIEYVFNPDKKEAIKKKAKKETLEEILLSGYLRETVYETLKNRDEMTNAGTEEIAGIKCAVYKNNADKANERLAKTQKEVEGLAALAKALGGDTKGIDAIKEKVSGIDGVTTYWIDPTKDKFIARKHIYLNMNGKITDSDSHTVTFFKEGNISDAEIPYNMSEYKLLN